MTTAVNSKNLSHYPPSAGVTEGKKPSWWQRIFSGVLEKTFLRTEGGKSKVFTPLSSKEKVEDRRVTAIDSKVNKLFIPGSAPIEPVLSHMGLSAQEWAINFSLAVREASSLPIPLWMGEPIYPDLPKSIDYQWLGFSTATDALYGLFGFYEASHDFANARHLGDKRGQRIAAADMGLMAGLMGVGVTFSGLHATGIGEVIHPGAENWTQMHERFELGGNIAASAGYTFAALGEGLRYSEVASFEKKFIKQANKVEYLRKRIGLNREKLEDKALKGKSGDDFYKAALEELRPLAKRNIKLLQKHGKIPDRVSITAEKIDQSLEKRLGKEALKEYGKGVLIRKLQEKKIAKMSRVLGGKEDLIKVLGALQNCPKEVERIVLAKLDEHSLSRIKRIALYAVGAIVLGLLCYFTAGVPLIILTMAFVAVAICELTISYHRFMHEMDQRTAPGRYDRLAPILGIALVTSGFVISVVFATVFSLGVAPLILGFLISAAWIKAHNFHLFAIEKRRENYMETVLVKKQISLEEFSYLCKYLPEEKLNVAEIMKKIPEVERKALDRLLKEQESDKAPIGKRYLKAIKLRQEEAEKASVEWFWKHGYGREFLSVDRLAG